MGYMEPGVGTAPGAKKFLAVCEGGLCRSHALVWNLKTQHAQDAVACGWRWNDAATFDVLCDWADYVVVMQQEFAQYIDVCYASKVRVLDVGPDRWCNPQHPELHDFIGKATREWSQRGFAL